MEALQAITSDHSKDTWRLYRCAAVWHIETTLGGELARAFLAATNNVARPSTRRRKLLRRIEPSVLDVIVRDLLSQRGELPKRVADLMVSMVATGLRPSEFAKAQLVGTDEDVLLVQNAKFAKAVQGKPGRGNGPSRELVFVETATHELKASVRRTLAWCSGRDWQSAQAAAVNRTFRAAVDRLVKRRSVSEMWGRLRLYDCRHQFSADAKANLDLLAGEVAAAMGHSSVVTAIAHYGKRKSARSSSTAVRPSAQSVAHVTEASKTRAMAMVSRTELGLANRDAEEMHASSDPGSGPGAPS